MMVEIEKLITSKFFFLHQDLEEVVAERPAAGFSYRNPVKKVVLHCHYWCSVSNSNVQ